LLHYHALFPLDLSLSDWLAASVANDHTGVFYDGYVAAVLRWWDTCAPRLWTGGRLEDPGPPARGEILGA
jgi:hypothetical protein